MQQDVRVARLIEWYENLTPENMKRLREYYSPEISFKDPFHTIQGIDNLERYFGTLFLQFKDPRFKFVEFVVDDNRAFLVWNLTFCKYLLNMSIRGSFFIIFDENNLVRRHEDFWDTSEQIFEQIPIFGFFFVLLKKLIGPGHLF